MRELSGGEGARERALENLGRALGRKGRTAVGGAPALAGAARRGVLAAGGDVLLLSLDCPVQWAGAAAMLGLPAAVFVEEREGRTCLHVFGSDGLPPAGDWAEELERALAGEISRPAEPARPGRTVEGNLTPGDWADWTVKRARLRRPALRGVTAAVGRSTPEDRAIRAALTALGCALEERWRPGIPAFRGERGGFALSARDERGAEVDPGQLLAVLVLIEMENGAGKAAVSAGSSAAAELVAAGYGGTVLRLGRDGTEARKLYAAQPWMGQAPAAAVRLCSRMGVAGQRLERLVAKTPRFAASRREVPLTADGARVISALAGEPGSRREGAGLRLRTGKGWVYLSPAPRRPVLRVLAEGPDLELAAELCDRFARLAARADGALSGHCAQDEDK